MKLSKRLNAVAEMVTPGSKICDVGTDHAYLPIELIKSGKIEYAVAMDINSGPLERAVQHISENHLESKIECRLSDGMQLLEKDEVDCAVIAGMGGDLIAAIIEKNPDKTSELVLSPHTHYETVRRTLKKCGFRITAENMITEDDKFYLIIKAERNYTDEVKVSETDDCTPEKYDYFGELLIKNKNGVLLQYLIHEEEKYKNIPQKSQYLSLVKDAIQEMKND